MSAIFISYTTRDAEGHALAERVVEWLREWGYRSLFRDKDLQEGIPAGADWRRILHGTLAQCQAMVSVCSPSYRESEWCTAEVAVALDRGKTVFPLQVGTTELPLLLRNQQAIALEDLIVVTADAEPEAKERLRRGLERRLSWRDRMPLPPSHLGPFPGLTAYDERHAALFFGRDAELYRALDKAQSLEGGSDFLLLYGASGCGKSSLLKAGLVPELRRVAGDGLLVVDPFRPDGEPLQNLASHLQVAMERDGLSASFTAQGTVAELLRDLNNWRRKRQCQGARVLLPVDQFEDVFRPHTPTEEHPESEGDRFLAFLLALMRSEARVLLVATMRTDFLAVFEGHASFQAGLRWQEFQLEPMRPEFYAEVIEGPCRRFPLVLPAGLKEQMVADTGSGDALPLLAFTLQAMWKKGVRRRDGHGAPNPDKPVEFLWEDYWAIGTVEGSVREAAQTVEKAFTPEQLAALKDAFLDHLLRWNEEGEGQVAKQKALRTALPPASLPVIDRMIDRERLLVSDAGTVEIAHEALMRTWPMLERWIAEGKGALLQRLRVRRLADDLKPVAPQRQRRQALEQLATLAADGGSDARAVQTEATAPLGQLLADPACPEPDREDAALVLALVGVAEPLRVCLANPEAPPALRRRAAESLGLLARRLDRAAPQAMEQRQRIEAELEQWLRSDALDLLVSEGDGWDEHDRRLPLLQGASRGLQLAAAADLPLLGSGPGRVVPMLTLTALEEGSGLRIRTAVVRVPVWQLPLPGGEQIELVVVPEGPARLGSPTSEHDRQAVMDWFAANRDGCKGVDVEALRPVRLEAFALVRQPISQGQWRAVVEAVGAIERELDAAPGKANPESLWERHGQPSELAVDSVSWHQGREWLGRLNRWLVEQWGALGGSGEVAQLALPSENQWEGACRAGATTPFHFGDTLDGSWARYDATAYPFGRGRKTSRKPKQPWINGSSGLVNRWGLADLHGQLFEWCEDAWHPNPVGKGHPEDGEPWREEDRDLVRRESGQQGWKLLRGGSWFHGPHNCRAADRFNLAPLGDNTYLGLRPCCPSPPGSLLGT